MHTYIYIYMFYFKRKLSIKEYFPILSELNTSHHRSLWLVTWSRIMQLIEDCKFLTAANETSVRAYELIARFAIPFNVIPLQIYNVCVLCMINATTRLKCVWILQGMNNWAIKTIRYPRNRCEYFHVNINTQFHDHKRNYFNYNAFNY